MAQRNKLYKINKNLQFQCFRVLFSAKFEFKDLVFMIFCSRTGSGQMRKYYVWSQHNISSVARILTVEEAQRTQVSRHCQLSQYDSFGTVIVPF